MDTLMFHLLDTMRDDLKSLHHDDRMGAAARMMQRPSLVGNHQFRHLFSMWRRGVAL
jgi:hypothetical protein